MRRNRRREDLGSNALESDRGIYLSGIMSHEEHIPLPVEVVEKRLQLVTWLTRLEDYGVEWLVTCRTFWPTLLLQFRDARSLEITRNTHSRSCNMPFKKGHKGFRRSYGGVRGLLLNNRLQIHGLD